VVPVEKGIDSDDYRDYVIRDRRFIGALRTDRTNAEIIEAFIRGAGFTGILAIYGRPWTDFASHRFGLDYLEKQGIQVRKISVSSETKLALEELDSLDPAHTIIYSLLALSWGTLELYRAIKEGGFRTLVRHVDILPQPARRVAPTVGSVGAWLKHRASGFIREHPDLFGIKPVDYLLVGGRRSIPNQSAPVGRTHLLRGHASDYDTCIEMVRNGKAATQSESFAVFLDSDDFHHPDLSGAGWSPPRWEQRYYARLGDFFRLLETSRGFPVRIAAHPLSGSLDGARFGGREVIRGRTAELVRDSSVVIAHASTAVNIAVMLGKPILFVTDSDYQGYYMGPWVEAMAAALGKKPISLDSASRALDEVPQALEVDPSSYLKYIDLYIKGREG